MQDHFEKAEVFYKGIEEEKDDKVEQQQSKKEDMELKKPDEDKQDKSSIDLLIEKSSAELDEYFNSEEKMKEYLDFISGFANKYSFKNMNLIKSQMEGAAIVKSFTEWKKEGVSIKAGQKGLKILAPNEIVMLEEIDEQGNIRWVPIKKAKKETVKKYHEGKVKWKNEIVGFRIANVFDIAQTTMPKENYPKKYFNAFITDESEDSKKLFELVKETIIKNNDAVIRENETLGQVKGMSSLDDKDNVKIYLNELNSDLQNLKTLLHEYAHVKLKHSLRDLERPSCELQAEMTAYVVGKELGIDTKDHSFKYMRSWSKGASIKEKQNLLTEVNEVSKAIFSEIESNFLANGDVYQDKNKSKKNLKNKLSL
ncbi:ImmA/IrrE family metallo-endopeptidase [Mycoplasma zalophidermidis]|uniref:ImmA/IrrE family metallo-endopeptidase n=1 Tax=Mycoplasma zalophidermidis TaxID=398174 RepID=A0ABS6DRQ2_9MOLU|nr:ImmA/IrrE family metallo-endopeptidase [Mycoplasma zalophidermidis]MBU4693687.1 ImmA/IrrE family metallo-endopeptidase [Mycoplasma zalophidermidis]